MASRFSLANLGSTPCSTSRGCTTLRTEHGVALLLGELGIVRIADGELEVFHRRVGLARAGEERRHVDEACRFGRVDLVGRPDARDNRIGVSRLPRLDAGVEYRHPQRAA